MVATSRRSVTQSLINKKAKNTQSAEDRDRMRIKLLYDLLNRDRNELAIFNENLERFSTSSGLDRLISGKLALQERKVKVKEAILKQIKSKT